MALGNAGTITSHGLVWRVQGTPHKSRTSINLMRQGQYAQYLDVPTRKRAVVDLGKVMEPYIPVDTGMLKASKVVLGEYLFLGPKPYNRQKLKAQQAGRIYKQRKRGPVVKAKWYALPANVRSYQPEYIERAIDVVSRRIVRRIQQQQQAEEELERLRAAAALGVRRYGGATRPRPAAPIRLGPGAVRQLRRGPVRV